MFAVVNFGDDADGSLAVVPRSWLDADLCWWPPYKGSKLANAVKQQQQPDNTWAQYPAKVEKSQG